MKKKIYVVEGPIDSLFLDNCIAVAGADFNNVQGDLTVIYDNEPRNKEIVKQIEKTISQGRSVVLWPDSMKEKDINDMILRDYSIDKIMEIINKNTYSGQRGEWEVRNWKKTWG